MNATAVLLLAVMAARGAWAAPSATGPLAFVHEAMAESAPVQLMRTLFNPFAPDHEQEEEGEGEEEAAPHQLAYGEEEEEGEGVRHLGLLAPLLGASARLREALAHAHNLVASLPHRMATFVGLEHHQRQPDDALYEEVQEEEPYSHKDLQPTEEKHLKKPLAQHPPPSLPSSYHSVASELQEVPRLVSAGATAAGMVQSVGQVADALETFNELSALSRHDTFLPASGAFASARVDLSALRRPQQPPLGHAASSSPQRAAPATFTPSALDPSVDLTP